MFRVLAGMVLLSASTLALAADAAPPALLSTAPASAAQQALAQQYFKVAGIDKMYADKNQIEKIIDMQLKMADKGAAQNMPPEKAAEFHRAIEKIRPTLSSSVAEALAKARPELMQVIAKNYSEAELKALIAFYSTPEGKSVVAKNPAITSAMMEVSGKHMGAVMQNLQKNLMRTLQDSAAAGKKAPAGK
ncbi:MAG: DUF2059 domain-containing protein [Moraxellaceae bacterium]